MSSRRQAEPSGGALGRGTIVCDMHMHMHVHVHMHLRSRVLELLLL